MPKNVPSIQHCLMVCIVRHRLHTVLFERAKWAVDPQKLFGYEEAQKVAVGGKLCCSLRLKAIMMSNKA